MWPFLTDVDRLQQPNPTLVQSFRPRSPTQNELSGLSYGEQEYLAGLKREAVQDFSAGLDVANRLAAHDVPSEHDIALFHWQLSRALLDLGELDRASIHAQAALAGFRTVVARSPAAAGVIDDLANAATVVVDIERSKDGPGSQLSLAIALASEIAAHLNVDQTSPSSAYHFAFLLERLSQAYTDNSDQPNSVATDRRAVMLIKDLPNEPIKNTFERSVIALTYLNYATDLFRQDNIDGPKIRELLELGRLSLVSDQIGLANLNADDVDRVLDLDMNLNNLDSFDELNATVTCENAVTWKRVKADAFARARFNVPDRFTSCPPPEAVIAANRRRSATEARFDADTAALALRFSGSADPNAGNQLWRWEKQMAKHYARRESNLSKATTLIQQAITHAEIVIRTLTDDYNADNAICDLYKQAAIIYDQSKMSYKVLEDLSKCVDIARHILNKRQGDRLSTTKLAEELMTLAEVRQMIAPEQAEIIRDESQEAYQLIAQLHDSENGADVDRLWLRAHKKLLPNFWNFQSLPVSWIVQVVPNVLGFPASVAPTNPKARRKVDEPRRRP